ncbi:MAG: hypothetical protein IH840_13175 [Candidatus Heimdallarchaeota archaeon]|nr:hypothetical protein [Candidatus Heimdallarchaeota archaeon]
MQKYIHKINGKSVTQIRLEKVLELAKKKKVITHRDIIDNLEGVDSRFVAFRLCQEHMKNSKLIPVQNGNKKLNEYSIPTKHQLQNLQNQKQQKLSLQDKTFRLEVSNLKDFLEFTEVLEEFFIGEKEQYSIDEIAKIVQIYKEALGFRSLFWESSLNHMKT